MEDLTIGQRIAAKRRALGLSQIDLGEKMGVSRQSVSKWEADGAIPEIDKLIALSKLFGVTVGWLLGVEDDTQPETTAETEFTDREWEIIDRLTRNEPKLPKWQLPLTAAAAAISLCAAIMSGAALWSANDRRAELVELNRTLAIYTAGHEGLIPTVTLLESSQFVAKPSGNLEECTFEFIGYPAHYEAGAKAELVITLGAQEIHRLECEWDGSSYRAGFTVPVRSGYTASFELTEETGLILTSKVHDHLLTDLMNQRSFGTVSGEYGSWDYDGEYLTLSDMHITIEAPGVYRDTPDLWAKCDLVILGDGRELGRTDLLNRSKYARTVNFSSPNVDFFTKAQSIPIGPVSGISRLDVMLTCELTTGLQMQKVIGMFHPANWKLP